MSPYPSRALPDLVAAVTSAEVSRASVRAHGAVANDGQSFDFVTYYIDIFLTLMASARYLILFGEAV